MQFRNQSNDQPLVHSKSKFGFQMAVFRKAFGRYLFWLQFVLLAI